MWLIVNGGQSLSYRSTIFFSINHSQPLQQIVAKFVPRLSLYKKALELEKRFRPSIST